MGDGDATHGATPPVESHPDGEDPVPADTTSAAAARKSQACPSNIHGKASGETVGLDSSNHGNPARAKPWAGPDASGCGLTLQHPLVLPPAPCHSLCEFYSILEAGQKCIRGSRGRVRVNCLREVEWIVQKNP
jgi:hypothetical protein